MSSSAFFGSTRDDEHLKSTRDNFVNIVDTLPYYVKILIKPLASVVLKFILNVDDKYTINVADENMSNGQYFSLLRCIGAHFEEFQRSDLVRYLTTKEEKFNKKIWSPGDLNGLINDVVKFCSDVHEHGTVNTNAIKNVLSTMLKNEISCGSECIEKKEIIILYSEKSKTCGVMRVDVTGNKIEIDGSCCGSGKSVDLNIKRCGLIFLNTQDVLQTIRTFVETCRR